MKVLEDKARQHADGSWHWDYIGYPTELCDMCENRINEGKLPSCVQMCQAKCLHYGSVDECTQMLAEKGNKAAVFMP
jgi:Fe-S-cluster-containing dehydrogenase component